jgi:hypothetical protein
MWLQCPTLTHLDLSGDVKMYTPTFDQPAPPLNRAARLNKA